MAAAVAAALEDAEEAEEVFHRVFFADLPGLAVPRRFRKRGLDRERKKGGKFGTPGTESDFVGLEIISHSIAVVLNLAKLARNRLKKRFRVNRNGIPDATE